MRTSVISNRWIVLAAGAVLVFMMRFAPTDVAAMADTPHAGAARDLRGLMTSASHRFDGGPVHFGPAPGR